jgi:hypothetical protein
VVLDHCAIMSAMSSTETPLPHVVLVHGAWHGAWCWRDGFTQRLEAAGLQVRGDLVKRGHPSITPHRIGVTTDTERLFGTPGSGATKVPW